MIKRIKIFYLKKLARHYYKLYLNATDIGCGIALGEYISSSAVGYKIKVNQTLAKLHKLDPKAPKSI